MATRRIWREGARPSCKEGIRLRRCKDAKPGCERLLMLLLVLLLLVALSVRRAPIGSISDDL